MYIPAEFAKHSRRSPLGRLPRLYGYPKYAAARTCDGEALVCPAGEDLYVGQYCAERGVNECRGGGPIECDHVLCATRAKCDDAVTGVVVQESAQQLNYNRRLATYETAQSGYCEQ